MLAYLIEENRVLRQQVGGRRCCRRDLVIMLTIIGRSADAQLLRDSVVRRRAKTRARLQHVRADSSAANLSASCAACPSLNAAV